MTTTYQSVTSMLPPEIWFTEFAQGLKFKVLSVDWRQDGKSLLNAASMRDGPAEVRIFLAISGPFSGPITFEVRRDFVAWFDDTIATKTVNVDIPPGGGVVDVTLEFPAYRAWGLRGYFIRISTASGGIYDEADVLARMTSGTELAYILLGR
jgi:hypothetical protein